VREGTDCTRTEQGSAGKTGGSSGAWRMRIALTGARAQIAGWKALKKAVRFFTLAPCVAIMAPGGCFRPGAERL